MTKKKTAKSEAAAEAPGKKASAKKKTAEKKMESEEQVAKDAKEAKADVTAADEPRQQKPESSQPRHEGPRSEPPRQGRGSGGFLGWLAFVLALAALTGSAYLVIENWRAGSSAQENDAVLAGLRGTIDATRDSLENLEQRLDSLAAKDVASVAELQSLERRFNERSRKLESLPGRVVNLEGSIASLQGISAGARTTWLLAEAEYYMQIANAQLQLAGNPHLASLALSFADERLLQLADPALTEVRRTLANELQAIEVMEKPDIEGVTLTLASLAGVVDSLPLRQEVDVAEGDADEVDPELSGLDRALASLKRAIGDVVSVRRTDEAAAPLTAPDAVYFLRANLALQLQAARLALLRGEKEMFEQSLDDAVSWLNRYYDADSAPVQGAVETISEIRNGLFSVSPPDISESLRLLRQHVTLAGSTTRPATEPEPGPEREPEPEPEPDSPE
jgi:uroporphyrin-3 C-methyltransferase